MHRDAFIPKKLNEVFKKEAIIDPMGARKRSVPDKIFSSPNSEVITRGGRCCSDAVHVARRRFITADSDGVAS